MSAARIPVIGIVGGIGSGKTALANALQHQLRCSRLDADSAGHRALRQPDIIAKLTAIFGQEILDPQGEVSRPAVARRVFGDAAEQRQARQQLETIVHPVIEDDMRNQLQQMQADGDQDVILLDAALLLEAGWSRFCDAVIFLDVPRETRVARVRERGWDEPELARREASQLSLEEKRARADLVLDQTGPIEQSAGHLANWIRERFQLQTPAKILTP
ncbi:dephospho-CoA kinase [Planctomicrobium piriforme]|uniref:Dephospho-CoA kinase n=1 Tax=Planctomicrobium piriforme TaxID=1576369 RepID=A0A1I3JES5_9PLAN|nr:dephospho-CoA kinase [Planctomicrobium piriforme]SFI58435.1 dephospho-CoA kinase [Planctomicrobium piriforme]